MKLNMTEDQRKHMGEARIAADRALVWESKANALGFNILAGFWREVNNILKVGIECQTRALNEASLLNQKTQKIIETQNRGLFDGTTTAQTQGEETQTHAQATGEKTKGGESRFSPDRR